MPFNKADCLNIASNHGRINTGEKTVKYKRQPAKTIARHYADELIEEYNRKTASGASDTLSIFGLHEKIFCIEMLALKCGWEDLSLYLEKWREDDYDAKAKGERA